MVCSTEPSGREPPLKKALGRRLDEPPVYHTQTLTNRSVGKSNSHQSLLKEGEKTSFWLREAFRFQILLHYCSNPHNKSVKPVIIAQTPIYPLRSVISPHNIAFISLMLIYLWSFIHLIYLFLIPLVWCLLIILYWLCSSSLFFCIAFSGILPVLSLLLVIAHTDMLCFALSV